MANITFVPKCSECGCELTDLKVIQCFNTSGVITSQCVNPCKCPNCLSEFNSQSMDVGLDGIQSMIINLAESTTTS